MREISFASVVRRIDTPIDGQLREENRLSTRQKENPIERETEFDGRGRGAAVRREYCQSSGRLPPSSTSPPRFLSFAAVPARVRLLRSSGGSVVSPSVRVRHVDAAGHHWGVGGLVPYRLFRTE